MSLGRFHNTIVKSRVFFLFLHFTLNRSQSMYVSKGVVNISKLYPSTHTHTHTLTSPSALWFLAFISYRCGCPTNIEHMNIEF